MPGASVKTHGVARARRGDDRELTRLYAEGAALQERLRAARVCLTQRRATLGALRQGRATSHGRHSPAEAAAGVESRSAARRCERPAATRQDLAYTDRTATVAAALDLAGVGVLRGVLTAACCDKTLDAIGAHHAAAAARAHGSDHPGPGARPLPARQLTLHRRKKTATIVCICVSDRRHSYGTSSS